VRFGGRQPLTDVGAAARVAHPSRSLVATSAAVIGARRALTVGSSPRPSARPSRAPAAYAVEVGAARPETRPQPRHPLAAVIDPRHKEPGGYRQPCTSVVPGAGEPARNAVGNHPRCPPRRDTSSSRPAPSEPGVARRSCRSLPLAVPPSPFCPPWSNSRIAGPAPCRSRAGVAGRVPPPRRDVPRRSAATRSVTGSLNSWMLAPLPARKRSRKERGRPIRARVSAAAVAVHTKVRVTSCQAVSVPRRVLRTTSGTVLVSWRFGREQPIDGPTPGTGRGPTSHPVDVTAAKKSVGDFARNSASPQSPVLPTVAVERDSGGTA